MFTGDSKIQKILHVVENGILLQRDTHGAFWNLRWGIETKTENANCRHFINAFRGVYFQRPGVGTGTELHFLTSLVTTPEPKCVRSPPLSQLGACAYCGTRERRYQRTTLAA